MYQMRGPVAMPRTWAQVAPAGPRGGEPDHRPGRAERRRRCAIAYMPAGPGRADSAPAGGRLHLRGLWIGGVSLALPKVLFRWMIGGPMPYSTWKSRVGRENVASPVAFSAESGTIILGGGTLTKPLPGLITLPEVQYGSSPGYKPGYPCACSSDDPHRRGARPRGSLRLLITG
jgi:hypothetical protein